MGSYTESLLNYYLVLNHNGDVAQPGYKSRLSRAFHQERAHG